MSWFPEKSFLKTRMGSTIAFVAPLILLVALAGYLRLTTEIEEVTLTVDLPQSVAPLAGESGFLLDITLRLSNSTNASIDLVALNNCEVLRWFLLDETGSFIQSQLLTHCGDTATADMVGPESTLVRTTSIALDPSRLFAGEEYLLVVRFWGYEARETFTVDEAG